MVTLSLERRLVPMMLVVAGSNCLGPVLEHLNVMRAVLGTVARTLIYVIRKYTVRAPEYAPVCWLEEPITLMSGLGIIM